MADLTTLANQFDPHKTTCRTIIETPKGSRNKFDYDPDPNLFVLAGLLPEGMMWLARNTAGSGHGPWYLARSQALARGLSNAYFRSLGLPSLIEER
jgi:hypothetical protein